MGFIAKSSNFNAAGGEGYNVDTSSGDITATLPSASATTSPMIFYNGTGSNNIILSGTVNGISNLKIPQGKTVVVVSDGAVFYISGSNLSVLNWVRFTKTHTNFQTAATTNDIELFSLPAGAILHAILIKHSVAFAGTGITSYTISVGITGALTKYASAFNVFQAVADTTLQLSSTLGIENWGVGTSIRAQATANVNLSNSTAGTVEIYALVSQVKT